MSFGPGDDVVAPSGDGRVITKRLGGAIQVELKNGTTVWTTWAKCRIEAPSSDGN